MGPVPFELLHNTALGLSTVKPALAQTRPGTAASPPQLAARLHRYRGAFVRRGASPAIGDIGVCDERVQQRAVAM
jgi:hypothetical protein